MAEATLEAQLFGMEFSKVFNETDAVNYFTSRSWKPSIQTFGADPGVVVYAARDRALYGCLRYQLREELGIAGFGWPIRGM
jgi:hypothetical protein